MTERFEGHRQILRRVLFSESMTFSPSERTFTDSSISVFLGCTLLLFAMPVSMLLLSMMDQRKNLLGF